MQATARGRIGEQVTTVDARLRIRPRQVLVPTAIVLAFVAILLAIVRLTRVSDAPELQDLVVAFAHQPTRAIEGRLAGGFAYAPPPSPRRGAEERKGWDVAPDVRIAAARIEMRARHDDARDRQAALGVAHLVTGELDGAIDLLEDSARALPDNSSVTTNLAAAYLARAKSWNRQDDWPRALAAAERAVAADHTHAEALFNRALALEGLHLNDEAEAAWTRYLDVERLPAWRREAVGHQATLANRPRTPDSPAHTTVDRQPVRERIEDDLLGGWAEAMNRGDTATAAQLIETATRAAGELARIGGDTMPLDAVRTIRQALDRHDAPTIRILAAAHAGFRQARRLFLGERLIESSIAMADAATQFARVGSPYRLWGPVYAATAVRMAGSPAGSLERLASVSTDGLSDTYYNLRGRLAWTKGTAYAALAQHDLSRDQHRLAVDLYQRGGELENLSANQTYLAEAEWFLGERQSAWLHEIAALANLDRLPVTTRRNHTLFIGAYLALSDRVPETALHFQNTLVQSIEQAGFTFGRPTAYMQRARILTQLHDTPRAIADLDQAERARIALPDPALRTRNDAEIRAIRADVRQHDAPRDALRDADAAIVYFRESRMGGHLARLFLLKASIFERLGDVEASGRSLREARDAFEQDRAGLTSPDQRLQAFEDERRVFRALLRFESVLRHEPLAALRVAEQGRVRTPFEQPEVAPVDPEAVRRSLPADVGVIYYAALDDRLLGWVLTTDRIEPFDVPLPATELRATVAHLRRRIRDGETVAGLASTAASFSQRVLAPALRLIADRRTLVFVPDGSLVDVPFAMLPQVNGAPLLADFTVLLAPSLTAFLSSSATLTGFAPDSVLAIGDGHDVEASDLPIIPSADKEAAAIGQLYPHATVLPGASATRRRLLASEDAVMHFAGHTVADPDFPLYSRLLLAPEPGRDNGLLMARDIVRHRFDKTRVLVLATCDGATGKTIDGEGLLSVAEAFRASGVSVVIASLWPVDDQARDFLTTFHRTLRVRHDPAAALHASQLALLREHGLDVPVRAWGGFVALGGLTLPPHAER